MSRKFTLSTPRKNEERKRQEMKVNRVGRPPKVKWVPTISRGSQQPVQAPQVRTPLVRAPLVRAQTPQVRAPRPQVQAPQPQVQAPQPQVQAPLQMVQAPLEQPPQSVCSPASGPMSLLLSKVSLPTASWIVQPSGFCKVEQPEGCTSAVVTRSINIQSDLTWTAFVHGKELARSCSLMIDIGEFLDLNSLQHLVETLHKSRVCCGNYEQQFVSLLISRNGKIARQDGTVSAYLDSSLPTDGVPNATVRSAHCSVITSKSRCDECTAYRKNLRAIISSSSKVTSPMRRKRLDSSSHTNYRHLHSPELRERLHNSKCESRSLKVQLDQMKARIGKLTQSAGVTIDSRLDSDMRRIVAENNHALSSSYPPGSFARIFWDQQNESLQKNPKQMRWHPMMIKWCIHLKMLSSSCYNSLRTSGVVRLPSERTLRDYTHVVKARSGLHGDVDEQLEREANVGNAPEHQLYVTLTYDEVKIKEDLVYDKHTGELIGFTNLSDINNHLSVLERACRADGEDENDEADLPQLATHMLVFMVRGICSSLKFPYAQFPVRSLAGDTLHPIVWECLEHVESLGFKVLAFISDGASCNRKFYSMHGKGSAGISHKITNPYAAEDRPIFFISDIPHLLKTVRNSWANSHAHSNTRHLWINGHDISWQHLVKLYQRHCTVQHSCPGLSKLHKLKYEHLHLTSYSKMRVDLAAQVLSTSVADALSDEDDSVRETERFARFFDRFFDCMNVRDFNSAVYKRKPDLRPYKSCSDSRLSWLENDLLSYLREWEESVKVFYEKKYEEEKLKRLEEARSERSARKENEADSVKRLEGARSEQSANEADSNVTDDVVEESEGEHADTGMAEAKGREEEEKKKKKEMRKREKSEKEKMKREIEKSLIARETRNGISFTVKAVVELVKYCLSSVPGCTCVLTEHLNQDPLEAFFGRQRMGCGRNDNPDSNTFVNKTVSLRVQGSAALQPFRGNSQRRKRSQIQPIPVDNTPLEKRKRSSAST